ncbi:MULTISPECIES: hypothetical protein [Rhodomicrobium]|uniref:hypothetical protein n=1 Tax=Rhodomicrobium TaxID=1068 RepID=UPI000B4A59CD|nr:MULTISPECIES: hypothetical protein [Rhodomicrobium]
MNVAERLSREIVRVTVLRAAYVHGDNPLSVPNTVAVIAIMTAAIETGHNAAGSGSVVKMMSAIRTLEGFTA